MTTKGHEHGDGEPRPLALVRGANRGTASPRRVAVASGGTGGHVYLALAVADAYRRGPRPADVIFIGTPEGLERGIVASSDIRFFEVPGSPLVGEGLAGRLRALWNLAAGAARARRVLRETDTALVVGFGGYASAGALLAGLSLGLPTAIHEPNAVPGLANRVLARLVDRVCLGFAGGPWRVPASRARVTGIPVRPEIASLAGMARSAPPLDRRAARVLVLGGSTGSPFLNEAAPDLVARAAGAGLRAEARHQTGASDPGPVADRYARAGVPADVVRYIGDVAEAYAWADFVVAPAGAGTLAEVAAAGVPGLFVPLSRAAEDHQAANAEAFASATGAWWVAERDWRAEALAARLVVLLADPAAYARASEGVRRFASPGAALAVAAECDALLAGES